LPVHLQLLTIINVQGRKSRYRGADDVERLIRDNAAQGVDGYFITDDNFARNKNWDRITEYRAVRQAWRRAGVITYAG
jgi:uncharacterized protein YbjT (DUF2867 family)